MGLGTVVLPATVAGARTGQDGTGAAFGGAGQVTTTVATTGAVSSTTLPTTATTASGGQTLVESEDPPATRLVTESRKVLAVIGGLVIVALALALLTVRYWRQTKPVAGPAAAPVEPGPADGAAPAPDAAPEPEAPVVVDTAAAAAAADDDDIWTSTGELPAVGTTPPVAEAEAATVDAAEPATTTPAPDVDATAVAGAAAAPVAGAAAGAAATDHAGADGDWEPRTGEHARVEIPAGSTVTRPGSAARRRALGLGDGDAPDPSAS